MTLRLRRVANQTTGVLTAGAPETEVALPTAGERQIAHESKTNGEEQDTIQRGCAMWMEWGWGGVVGWGWYGEVCVRWGSVGSDGSGPLS